MDLVTQFVLGDSMPDSIPLGAVALLLVMIVLLVVLLGAKGGRKRHLPLVPRRLMTARERDVISLIEAAAPHCRVHAQVAMAALIDTKKGLPNNERVSVRNRFDRKMVDFVLEDRASGDVLAIVELDDRTHDTAKDRLRDEITEAAGYRTVRFAAGKKPDHISVHEQILACLAPNETP